MRSTGSFDISNPRKENSQITINTISKELSCSENACQNDLTEPVWKCRYVITIIVFLVVLFTNIHRTVMGVVIVAMVNNTAIIQNSKAKSESCANLLPNSTEDDVTHGFKKTDGDFFWSPETQGYILGSFFFGHIFSTIPAGRLAERYGCKWLIVGSILTTGIGTVLIPPFSWLSASAVIVIQAVRGFALGMAGPCLAILTANWFPKNERGFIISITLSANPLGPALGNIFSGYVSELTNGWSYALYSIGGSSLLLAACISLFVAENPKEHSSISKAELNYILRSQESTLPRRRPKLPYRQLLTSVPLYASIIGIVGRNWKLSQFWLVHSTFLGTILHYPIGQNGLFSAIPFLLSFLTSILSSCISGHLEKKKVFSVDFLRKFWVFISDLLYSLCLLGVYIAGCNSNLSVIFSILSLGLTGLGTPGVTVAIQDMAPTFSGTILAICVTAGYLSSITLPMIVGFLTNEMQTLEQWNKVFFISIGVVMTSAIIFCVFGSAKTQPWNFAERENDKTDRKVSKNEENGEKTRY